jgi:hypothetical protein
MVRRLRVRGTKEEEILELRADILYLKGELDTSRRLLKLERAHSARVLEKLAKAEMMASDMYRLKVEEARTATEVMATAANAVDVSGLQAALRGAKFSATGRLPRQQEIVAGISRSEYENALLNAVRRLPPALQSEEDHPPFYAVDPASGDDYAGTARVNAVYDGDYGNIEQRILANRTRTVRGLDGTEYTFPVADES